MTVGKKNRDRFVLLSQDVQLHDYFLQKVVQLPIIFFFNNSVLQIKPVSPALNLKIERKNLEKLKQSNPQKKQLKKARIELKNEIRTEKFNKFKKQRSKLGIKIKKKVKGPNPLSNIKKNKKKVIIRKVVKKVTEN